jgi:transcriptional regulator with XRE-family HTH domain
VPEMARQLRGAARELKQQIAEHGGLVRMVYSWERGDHDVSERYALLYAKALDVSADELAGGPAKPGVSSILPVVGIEDGDDPVKRRRFVLLAASAMSLLDVMRSYSSDLPERVAHGSRVDSETAAGLENVMLGYRQIYQSAGAAALLDPVCGTLRLGLDDNGLLEKALANLRPRLEVIDYP